MYVYMYIYIYIYTYILYIIPENSHNSFHATRICSSSYINSKNSVPQYIYYGLQNANIGSREFFFFVRVVTMYYRKPP
jgi:hypothetical protein